jgi:phosphatidylglycerophosphatase A
MKTFLKDKSILFQELREQIFTEYPQADLEDAVIRLLMEVKDLRRVSRIQITDCLMEILNKTETYNVMTSILELENHLEQDEQLSELVRDPSFNVHRTIAMSICGMYGTGAISFFGFIDCKYRFFFPMKHPKSFLSKGICAIVASTASLVVDERTKENFVDRNIELLASRGVSFDEVVEIVDMLQRPYNPTLDIQIVRDNVIAVLRKHHTYHAIVMAVKMDVAVEQQLFSEQYNYTVGQDEGLFGVDESVATAISLCYGTIALTNFGYLDKLKPGVISRLDSDHEAGRCNTFMDDIICGIASAACGRLAHNNPPQFSKPVK